MTADQTARPTTQPLISVVIPCHNAGAWIGDAIRSVLAQDYANKEIVVVDDGSTDDSLARTRAFGDRIVSLAIANGGACAARNRGLAAARGEYVLFLDADDLLEGHYLTNMARHATGEVDLVIGAHVIESEDGTRHPRRAWSDIDDVGRLMQEYLQNFLQTAAFLWRRPFFVAQGGWDEALPIGQDTDVAVRMIAAGPRFRIADATDAVIVWRSVGDGNRITTKMTERKRRALLHVLEKNRAIVLPFGGAVRRAYAGRYYALAKIAYACSDRTIGDRALASARALGLRGHPGSIGHRGIATMLGLNLRMRVGAAKYRYLSRAPAHLRPYPYNLC